jgi:enolase-phosphatase E1
MTLVTGGCPVEAVVLDIEGTTTPISFVADVLVPFARRELPRYVHEHLEDDGLGQTIRQLRDEWRRDAGAGAQPPPWDDRGSDVLAASVVAYAGWLMDRDRKSSGLKSLQARAWARGYADGSLRGEVFPDVPPALARWRRAGVAVAIFSSGSVLAQRLLFQTTPFGDLTPWIDAHFDTETGPKISADSYRAIGVALNCPPARTLFVSDALSELEAAGAAGCLAVMCVRHAGDVHPSFPTIRDFTEIA